MHAQHGEPSAPPPQPRPPQQSPPPQPPPPRPRPGNGEALTVGAIFGLAAGLWAGYLYGGVEQYRLSLAGALALGGGVGLAGGLVASFLWHRIAVRQLGRRLRLLEPSATVCGAFFGFLAAMVLHIWLLQYLPPVPTWDPTASLPSASTAETQDVERPRPVPPPREYYIRLHAQSYAMYGPILGAIAGGLAASACGNALRRRYMEIR